MGTHEHTFKYVHMYTTKILKNGDTSQNWDKE